MMKGKRLPPSVDPREGARWAADAGANAGAVQGDRPQLPPRRRENRWLRPALIFVTCVLLADALFGDRGLAQSIRTSREHRQATEGLRHARNENAALREQQRRLREDPRAIEAVAREELGLIRPGEILVIVKTPR